MNKRYRDGIIRYGLFVGFVVSRSLGWVVG